MWSDNAADRALIAWLLEPYSIEDFKARHYERAPLHISRNQANRYERYFTLEEYERVLYGSIVRPKDLGMVKDGVAARIEAYAEQSKTERNDRKAPAYELIDPDRVSTLFSSGCSLVLDGVGKMSPMLANLCRGLEAFFGHRVNANVYLTPPGNQGFGMHYDTHDTLIIQIEGSKHWRVYNAPNELPLEDRFFDKKVHAVGEVQLDIVMQPGDVLYIPRGYLHEGNANDELSLHVTLGLFPQKWYHVLKDAVDRAAETEPSLRRSAEFEHLNEAAFGEILANIFTPEQLRGAYEHAAREFRTERRNGLDGQMRQIANLSGLCETSRVAMREHLSYELAESEKSTKISFSGKTLTMGPSAAAIVRELAATPSVAMSALLEKDASAMKIVRKLIENGFAIQLPREERATEDPAVA